MWSKYFAIYMAPTWCFGKEIFQGSPEPVYTRKLTNNNFFTLFVMIDFTLGVVIVLKTFFYDLSKKENGMDSLNRN